MFIKKGDFYEIDEFLKNGVRGIYTEMDFGNLMEMKKKEILKKLSLEDKILISGHQVHGDNIEIIKNIEKVYFEDTDGFITNRDDVVLFTKYADCLPIYFLDKTKNVIGVVHSGWQGSYKEIGLKAIDLMEKEYSSCKEDILVGFGVGIAQKNYEVGSEFKEKFLGKFGGKIVDSCFKRTEGKIFFDNQLFNKLLFLKKGIKTENIIENALCTYENKFHSYRRDGKNSGRNGGFICFVSER